MGVYFVLRSNYDNPSGKCLARYDDDTVNAWVRRNWELGLVDQKQAARIPDFGVHGHGVYGFHLFEQADGDAGPPPEDPAQLEEYLREHIYSEGPIICRPHLITVQTDDDELMFVYYIFDDHYVAQYPARAAFLLSDDWRLPGGGSDGKFRPAEPTSSTRPVGKGEGVTYWACESFEGSDNLLDLSPAPRVKGVRLPDLARYLARHKSSEDWPGYWLFLRARLFADGATSEPLEGRFREALLDDPDDEAAWAAYSDWLQERGLPAAGLSVLERALRSLAHYPALAHLDSDPLRGTVREARAELDHAMETQQSVGLAHDPARTLVRVDEHVAQLCLHVDSWPGRTRDLYHQWIFFDDRWAAAHPDLANSILRYTRCWDVLSPDGPNDEEE